MTDKPEHGSEGRVFVFLVGFVCLSKLPIITAAASQHNINSLLPVCTYLSAFNMNIKDPFYHPEQTDQNQKPTSRQETEEALLKC